MTTTKSEHIARILANVNQAAVNSLVDRLADTAVESDRLRAENESLKAQIIALTPNLAAAPIKSVECVPPGLE